MPRSLLNTTVLNPLCATPTSPTPPPTGTVEVGGFITLTSDQVEWRLKVDEDSGRLLTQKKYEGGEWVTRARIN